LKSLLGIINETFLRGIETIGRQAERQRPGKCGAAWELDFLPSRQAWKGDLLKMGTKKKQTKEKPLEKMTAKELREVALQLPEITGVHGLNKPELIQAIKRARGIEDEPGKQTDSSVRELKKRIKELRAKHETSVKEDDTKMAGIYRRRIIRLKKKSRRAA
jgi:hypothetical protein